MKAETRLRIAIQKSGRLSDDSINLLLKCGFKIKPAKNSLLCSVENLPIDILFVRDDDIPTLVMDNVCDLGIVGEDVLLEQTINTYSEKKFNALRKLGFSQCRLSIAFPMDKTFLNPDSLKNLKIATSYPNLLRSYLLKNNVTADIMTISGSVEIAPRLNMSDAICDLVSTGKTLKANYLKEVAQIMQSQAVLINTASPLNEEKLKTVKLVLPRIDNVLAEKLAG